MRSEISRIFAITRAAYSTAFTPSGASEEWQVRPRTMTLIERLPLWPITTSISVGSPTKHAAGIATPSTIFGIMRRTPQQPTSSSYENARCSGFFSFAFSMSGTAARQQAT